MKSGNIRSQLKMAMVQMAGMLGAGSMGSEIHKKLNDMNSEFMQRARGKGRGSRFKSIFKSYGTNPRYPQGAHQGAQECARRVANGQAGSCYRGINS